MSTYQDMMREFMRKMCRETRKIRTLWDIIETIGDGIWVKKLREILGSALESEINPGTLPDIAGSLDDHSKKQGRYPGTYPKHTGGSLGRGGFNDGSVYGNSNTSAGVLINTYPMGTKTNKVYPIFVGVCKENERLGGVLNAAEEYCEAVADYVKNGKMHRDEKKIVLILTNKWNESQFQVDYAGTYAKFAIQYNILFVFILFTVTGVVRIPFLPSDYAMIDDMRRWPDFQKSIDYGQNYLDKQKLLKLCQSGRDNRIIINITYKNEKKQFEIRFYEKENKYEFDCECVMLGIQPPFKRGTIQLRYIKKFAIAVSDYDKLNNTEHIQKNNSPTKRVTLFGKDFIWNATDDEKFKKLEDAVNELVSRIKYDA